MKYLIRWSFEYLDKRRAYGMWNQPAAEGDVSNQASSQDRTGLLYACVQVKSVKTREIKTVLRCPRKDYVQHRWIACAPSPTFGLRGAVRLRHIVQGITVVTRDEKVHVYVDGNVKREPMIEVSNNYA